MPETYFEIRWPDGETARCYSPSTIIQSYLASGDSYPLEDFMQRVDGALEQASERVRRRYGFACSSALDQLRMLQAKHASLLALGIRGQVDVLSVEGQVPRDARQDAGKNPVASAGGPRIIPVLVIGGGQAGLSMSYLLKQRGIDHVVLEKSRLAHAWRDERWDSFCLVTPNWQCRLPGYAYSGPDPQGFMVKEDIVTFLQEYADSFDPPLREGVKVQEVSPRAGRYLVETSEGDWLADQVVVATGGYHTPKVPAFAEELPEEIVQLHSRDYKRPEQLPSGKVLVVGSGQSGCQIAEDLLIAGRQVHLAVGDAPRCARRYRGRDVVEWFEQMGHYDIPIEDMPDPEVARSKTNHYVTGRDGGHDIDLREFARRGLTLSGAAVGYQDGKLLFAPNLKHCLDSADDTYRRINLSIDEFIEKNAIPCPPASVYEPVWEPPGEIESLAPEAENITSIVWSIGFAPTFDWLKVDTFDASGHPLHRRGVSPAPGLYFLGLPWLHTWGSGRFCGVARDAEYLVGRIVERLGAQAEETSVAAAGL